MKTRFILGIFAALLITAASSNAQEEWEETYDPVADLEPEQQWNEAEFLADSAQMRLACAKEKGLMKGVFAVAQFGESPKMQTWKSQAISGVVVRLYWRQLNPYQKKYDWTLLDEVFDQADLNSKLVHLMIAPGFYSPQWVIDDPRVKKDNFFVPQGPDKGQMKLLPHPWNDAYLQHWFTFLDTLAKKVGPEKSLALISVTGPNSHNGEVNLPRKASDANILKSSAPNYHPLQQWLEIVHTKVPGGTNDENELKDLMLGAYQKTLQKFCETFARKYQKHFALQIFHQSLPTNNQATQDDYQRKLINMAMQAGCCSNKGNYFVLMNGGLDGRPLHPKTTKPSPQWLRIKRLSGRIVTGLQTHAPEHLYKKGAGNKGDRNDASSPLVLAQALNNAIFYKAQFIECYEGDVLHEAFKSLIAGANALLQ